MLPYSGNRFFAYRTRRHPVTRAREDFPPGRDDDSPPRDIAYRRARVRRRRNIPDFLPVVFEKLDKLAEAHSFRVCLARGGGGGNQVVIVPQRRVQFFRQIQRLVGAKMGRL